MRAIVRDEGLEDIVHFTGWQATRRASIDLDVSVRLRYDNLSGTINPADGVPDRRDPGRGWSTASSTQDRVLRRGSGDSPGHRRTAAQPGRGGARPRRPSAHAQPMRWKDGPGGGALPAPACRGGGPPPLVSLGRLLIGAAMAVPIVVRGAYDIFVLTDEGRGKRWKDRLGRMLGLKPSS